MKLRTAPTTAELLQSMGVSTPSVSPKEGPDFEAALYAVLEALPNSRAELEQIIEQARELLRVMNARVVATEAELSALVNRQFQRTAEELRQTTEQGLTQISATSEQVARQVDDISGEVDGVASQMIETVGQVRSLEAWLRGRVAELEGVLASRDDDEADKAAFDALSGLVQSRLEEITVEFARLEETIQRKVGELRTHVDWRIQGVRSAPPSPTKIYSDGVLVGERRGLNFVSGANTTVAVEDNGSERITVTIGGSAASLGYVNHGATAGTARPSGFAAVQWVGSVEPTNAIDGDLWIDVS